MFSHAFTFLAHPPTGLLCLLMPMKYALSHPCFDFGSLLPSVQIISSFAIFLCKGLVSVLQLGWLDHY